MKCSANRKKTTTKATSTASVTEREKNDIHNANKLHWQQQKQKHTHIHKNEHVERDQETQQINSNHKHRQQYTSAILVEYPKQKWVQINFPFKRVDHTLDLAHSCSFQIQKQRQRVQDVDKVIRAGLVLCYFWVNA